MALVLKLSIIQVSVQFSSVQSLNHVRLFATPWTAAHQASLSITNSQSLLKFMSIESVMPSSHLILCCPLLLLPSVFPNIRVFSNESVLHIRWPVAWLGREANNSLKTNVGLCKCFSAIKLKNHREVMKYLGFTVINT